MNKTLILKGLLLLVVGLAVAAFVTLDLGAYLTLSSLQENRQLMQNYFHIHPFLVGGAYIGMYILVTALSLPGAAIMTLAGGALFGSLAGTVIVAFAATLGATLAFLSARFLFRDLLEQRYAAQLIVFNTNVQENAVSYMLFLRLIPAFPFFVINLVMGLTRIRLSVYMAASFVGMIPGTFVYANVGSNLALLTSAADIMKPRFLMAFILLGALAILPVFYKKLKAKR